MIINRLFKKISIKILMSRGYSGYMANRCLNDFIQDLFRTKVSLSQRLWAYKHGFLAKSILDYGLNESNLKDYEPDFHYYRLHPLNRYPFWIDDKLTFKYMLYPFADHLPEYYFELNKRRVYKLVDCPGKLKADIPSIVDLLQEKKILVAKLVSGTVGRGFYKIEFNDNKFLVNNKAMSKEALHSFLRSLNRYLITEHLTANDFIKNIYDGAPGTLRVMVINDHESGPRIIVAIFRIGTSKTEMLDYGLNGGFVFCGVDITSGRLYSPKYQEGTKFVDITVHPDTKTKIEGKIPFWETIEKEVIAIARYLPQLTWMGFDVIITGDSFKIIEINSHQGLHLIQAYCPLLKDERVKRLFYKKENFQLS